jgi:SAM-dependent methyltransferase
MRAELLDDPRVPDAVRVRSIADVRRSNVIFGGRRSALRALRPLMRPGARLLLLDVGTGLGDLPAAARAAAARRGCTVVVLGVDEAPSLLHAAGVALDLRLCANAMALPLADASVDVVLCSQLLHHFDEAAAARLLTELDRVARQAVVVSDLRRSWLAAAGFWLSSFPLRFHPVTRHDGVVSVLRGFTAAELRRLIIAATGATPVVRRSLGFRLTATWTRTPPAP